MVHFFNKTFTFISHSDYASTCMQLNLLIYISIIYTLFILWIIVRLYQQFKIDIWLETMIKLYIAACLSQEYI